MHNVWVAGRHVIDSPDSERLAVLRNDLRHVRIVKGGVRLPGLANQRADGIVVSKCRYMDSAKKPLWINMTNTDPAGEEICKRATVEYDL